jgi:exosortase family protein XrtM
MPPSSPRTDLRPLWFLVRFVLGYTVLFALYGAVPNEVLRDVVFHYGLTQPSALLIDLVAPAERARAVANTIVSPRATLEIVRGCEGAGTFFLLGAAMLAFDAPWRRKLAGLAWGFAVVYLLNLARIVGLYFIVAHRETWFLVTHTYVAPIAVIAAVAAFFWWWALAPRPQRADGYVAA